MISNDSEGSFNLAYWERLIHYLDANLITLKQELDSGLFDRVLELVCQRVLHCFYDAVCIHVEVNFILNAFIYYLLILLLN